MDRFTVTSWPVTAGQVTINKIRARLEQEGLYPSRFDMMPGDSYPDHAHPDAEIRWVVSGQMRVVIGRARPFERRSAETSRLPKCAPGPREEGPVLAGPGPGGCNSGCERKDEIILGPGDRLDLAPNVAHSADVVGDEVVVTVSASR